MGPKGWSGEKSGQVSRFMHEPQGVWSSSLGGHRGLVVEEGEAASVGMSVTYHVWLHAADFQ
jgi:hypothetical protein